MVGQAAARATARARSPSCTSIPRQPPRGPPAARRAAAVPGRDRPGRRRCSALGAIVALLSAAAPRRCAAAAGVARARARRRAAGRRRRVGACMRSSTGTGTSRAVTLPALLALGVLAAARRRRARRAPSAARALVLVAAALAGWLYLVSVALPAVADQGPRGAAHGRARRHRPRAADGAPPRAPTSPRGWTRSPSSRCFAGAAIADAPRPAARGAPPAARRRAAPAVQRAGLAAPRRGRLRLGDARGASAAVQRALALDPLNPRTRALAANAVSNLAPPQDSPTATGTPLS